MKKVLFILFCMAIVLSWSFSAHAERKFSYEVPDGAVIPSKASVTITKYEKVLPEYGECAGGEAVYAMALSSFGVSINQDEIHKASGLKKTRGCYSNDLYYASMVLGIDMQSYVITGFKSKKDIQEYLNAIKYFISQGYPVVISWDEDLNKKIMGDFCSYALVVGYDDEGKEITVVDPYNGTEKGRVFSYEVFLGHWLWPESNGTMGFVMDAIKGKLKDPKSRLKTVTFHITEGQTVEIGYLANVSDQVYLLVGFNDSQLVVWEEGLGMDRNPLWERVTNDAENPNIEVWGGGQFYLHFTSRKGQGDISITYEPKDGDLFLKQ